jgi:mannose-6-phosphate isomerase
VRAFPLTPTRVYRFYTGGALLGDFRGRPEHDGPYPEDWLGSLTSASNPGRDEPEAGLSRLADGRLLRDAVEHDPIEWLGREHVDRFGPTTGLLVKLLDAGERLPVHAHPSREFAARHLASALGKTEAWLILATRTDSADVFVGLRDAVEPARYRDWIERQDAQALRRSLNHVPVAAGDLVYVPAGVPHAIGEGLLIAELQEATDFSIVCEWSGFPIDAADAHLGLGWDVALGALDLGGHEPIRELPPAAAAFFWADEDAGAPTDRFRVLLVLEGEGTIDGEPAARGDAFVVPAALSAVAISPGLRVLRCLGPDPARAAPRLRGSAA